MTTGAPELDDIRRKIDSTDDAIVRLLAERLHYVRQVGKRKVAFGMGGSFIRSGREAAMLRSLAKKLDGVMSPRAAVAIWRVIISSSLSAEKAFTAYAGPSDGNVAYWLAREYFGGAIPVRLIPDNENLVRTITDEPTAVGVASVAEGDAAPWWLRPKHEKNALYVFASLPFAGGKELCAPPTFAFANIVPEQTDADATLVAFSLPAATDLNAARERIEAAGARIVASAPLGLLARFDAYLSAQGEKLTALSSRLPPHSEARVLGHYAVPLD
ncbi:MAG: chorismate mutase [Rickettsiales bacterium]